jgi:hypothetical protein
VVEVVRERIPVLTAEITDRLRSEIPELPMTNKNSEAIQGLVQYVIGATLAAVDTRRPGPITGNASTVLHDLPPSTAQKLFRVTVERSWKALIEAADGLDQARLLHLARGVFQQTQELHITARTAALPHPHLGMESELRRSLAMRLLRGEPADALADRLGLKLAPSYIVAVPGTVPEIGWYNDERHGMLTVLDDEHAVALLPCRAPPSRNEVASQCQRMLRQLTGRTHPLVAVASATSRERIASAADEAKAVLHVVRAVGLPADVYQLYDIPLEAALVRSPDLADLLAHRLIPLHGSGAPMLETLQVYLQKGQDRRQAARALHVHPNTLDYRLRRIRELTRLSPTAPRDIQTLGAAITAWRLTRGAYAEASPSPPDAVARPPVPRTTLHARHNRAST